MMTVVIIEVYVWVEVSDAGLQKACGWTLHLLAKPNLNRLINMHPMIAKVPTTGKYPCSHASASACDIRRALR